MRIVLLLLLWISPFFLGFTQVYAAGTSGAESAASIANSQVQNNNILGIEFDRLRNGDITMADIPLAIVSVIQFLLAIAGSVAVAALIYHAVKMQLASGITGDSSGVDKAKAGMKGAMIGFVVSIMAWFLVTRFVEILTSIT